MQQVNNMIQGSAILDSPGVVGHNLGAIHNAAGQGRPPLGQQGHRQGRKIHQRYNKTATSTPHECLTLNEAAKLELETLPSKTPVSVLQELLARRGSAPKYELVQIEGFIHQPTFRYRVSVSEFFAHGTGRTKKNAKHRAAKALLEKLAGENTTENNNSNGSTDSVDASADPFEVNPIGWLQELCMKKILPPPQYVTEMEEGPLSHEKEFTVACVLMNHREMGRAKNKKMAKRLAALRMWQLLQDSPQDSPNSDDEVSKIRRELINKLGKHANPTIRPGQGTKSLKNVYGEILSKLQTTALNKKDFNYVQFLLDLKQEPSFDVVFTDIEEKSSKNQHQCLVRLSTIPPVICYGVGNTTKEAQSVAAHSALEYLKLMVSKK